MGPTNIFRVRAVSADSTINRKYSERFYVGFLAANAAREAMLDKMVADDDWYTMRGVKPAKVRTELDGRYMRLVAPAKGNGVKYEVNTPWVELDEIKTEN